MAVNELLRTYAHRIRELRGAEPNVPETGLAPAFQQLLQDLVPELGIAPGLIVVPEYRNPGVGRPDIALVRQGAPPRAFVELKAPAKPADPARWRGQDALQFERFKELPCWATCNFTELRLFFRDNEQESAIVLPEKCLRPDRGERAVNLAIDAHDPAPFLRLVETLFVAAGTEPSVRDADELAASMAHSARLVRGIVQDRLAELLAEGVERHPLLDVQQEFREVLYAHPEAGGYTARDFSTLFSAAFAQTLAFGLLLVREGTGEDVGPDAWQHMPAEHPLMRTALRVLSQPEIVRDMGIGFDVMRDTINSFAPQVLAVGADGRDPILNFYEDFLKTFDPVARERYGVYYTPFEVVRYMVGALDRALRDSLGTQGMRDHNVTILDPAVGTGTFLLGIAQRVRVQGGAGGEGMAALALQELTSRMFGFELLVGPYAVAHYRLHHALRGQQNGDHRAVQLPRLGVYLADTLAEPGAAAPIGRLGFVAEGISEERREANRIKTQQPILAIIGNPPYRRLLEGENHTLVGDWMDELWDDLKAPVRGAGHGNQLNTFPELSVAFWRWAIWKLFESENAPGRGVVAFISNRKFLTGWPYAGLRKMMREQFDRIEIFDLRGDVRRGERAGVDTDQGVFNIQVGTAITIAIADGSKADGEAADVFYSDSWAERLFSRQEKFDRLVERSEMGSMANPIAVVRGLLDDMRPEPFQSGEWVSLEEIFSFSKSGMKSGDDDVFTSPVRGRLRDHVTPRLAGRAGGYDNSLETYYSYRPLDRRWFYNDLRLLDRPGPAMQQVWGANNVGLYALPSGTGGGPAVWCHGLLPDYHAFRGSYGGYVFALYDRRPRINSSNVVPKLIEGLSAAYGGEVTAEDAFDAILTLLSATSYALRFAEDLEDTFPHVAFPVRRELFQDAVRIGREIRAVETFAREPSVRHLGRDFVRLEDEPRGAVATAEPDGEALALCANGTGRITGLPQAVWDFSVSGYRVLPRWLEARQGLPADLAFVREFRDICGRIAELIDLFNEADIVLDAALRETLSREALNLPPRRQQADDQRD